jgi:Domain of unknown function (DUF4362)
LRKWIIALLSLIFLVACSQEEEQPTKKADNFNSDDITISYSGIENADRFNDFSKRVAQHQTDEIRITQRTLEGDPIYQTIKFDGKVFQYIHDSRKDAFGAKEVTKDRCEDFRVIEKNTETTALLEKCAGRGSIELFYLSYDSLKEDRLDFALKYGENLEKIIDTNKTNIPNKEKNIVFKNLVYIDFLKDKKLKKSCSDSTMQYELTVWINGGERHYKWYDCDIGPDAKSLTGVAETIIKVFEHN